MMSRGPATETPRTNGTPLPAQTGAATCASRIPIPCAVMGTKRRARPPKDERRSPLFKPRLAAGLFFFVGRSARHRAAPNNGNPPPHACGVVSAWGTAGWESPSTCIATWLRACRKALSRWLTMRWRRPYRNAPKRLGSSWDSNRGVATTLPSYYFTDLGHVAEWLRNGLQIHLFRLTFRCSF
jgi:hypothetical protein